MTAQGPIVPGFGAAPIFEFASGADIIRANQKDQYYTSLLASQVQSIARRVFGARTLYGINDEIVTGASLLYLGLTTLVGQSTLGEEYCDITYTDPTGLQIPSLRQRAIFSFNSTLLPYILTKSWPKLRRRFKSAHNSSTSAPSYLVSLRNYLTVQNLLSLHLAIFYFTGTYYTIARRVAGLRYIFVRKMDGSPDRIGYEILGCLMLIRLGIQISTDLFSTEDGEAAFSGDGRVKINLEDDSLLPFLDGQARSCTLCLSSMQDPTATPCGHLFCWTCIHEWTRTKPECPLCRQGATPSHLLPIQP